MSIRYVERSIVLRLFESENLALATVGAVRAERRGPGWLAVDAKGQWMDDAGLLPGNWGSVAPNPDAKET